MSKKLVIDIESNGFKGSSVLSFSALVLDDKNQILEEIDRYYYPTENINKVAVGINGLNKKVLKVKREGVPYPEHFIDDIDFIKSLFTDCNEVIAHNVEFDMSFITAVYQDAYEIKDFCTMLESTNIVCIPGHYGNYKWPKLEEAVDHFKINTSEFGGTFHSSLFDCKCTLEIYKKLNY